MAAISPSPPSSIIAALPRARSGLAPSVLRLNPRRSISCRLYSSKPPSGHNGSLEDPTSSSPSPPELHHALPPLPSSGRAVPVFVTLPADAIRITGQMARAKTMRASFMALASAGVEGVVVEFWWGIVEREAPGVYDWGGYMDLVTLARRYGLKVRAVMAFHQCGGTKPDGPCWIPLPKWVLEEMEKLPDLAFSDRFGRRNREYISLGCDILPVLNGRTPVQAYSDFMRSFRDTFREFLGVIVTEVQVGMGPAGELRYPSRLSEQLTRPNSAPELGEFQCYDKYMLSSLNACAWDVGKRPWGISGPLGASNLLHNPENTTFFRDDGSWNTDYGRFFLEWYSGMLLLHGERLCMVADNIFLNSGVKISAKVAGIYWHYGTNSHPSELTAGYYNTCIRDGYLPIAYMFARYRMTLCCTCFDMRDTEEQSNSKSSPEGYLRQLIYAARICNLPLSGEISVNRFDDTSLKQVIQNSRLYCNGAREPCLSFSYVRMNRNLFDSHNWNRFTRFVRQMSDFKTFQAKLDFRRRDSCISSISAAEDVGRSFVYH